MATSHLLILNYKKKKKTEIKILLSLLNYSLTHSLTHSLTRSFNYLLYRSSVRTVLNKLAGLKYHKYLSSSSICFTLLSYPLVYHTILYYTWDKRSYHACGKSMFKVKLSNFIIQGLKTLCNQRI